MITISLCMIVKNEEATISQCLESVKDLVDEIIIVDTGSTDKTKEVIKKYTNKVFDFHWCDDFAVARNYAYSQASMDFILWLDADDVMLEADRLMFQRLKQNFDPSIDAVMMKYNAGFDEHGNITLSYFRERLTKRINNYKWHEPVHEYLEIDGKIINSDISITHLGKSGISWDRNLLIYEKTLAKGLNLSTRGLYYYGRELFYHKRYDDAITYLNKFLNNDLGWVEDKIYACYLLSLCHHYEGETNNKFSALLKSFKYADPRAEICCLLGYYAMEDTNYTKAIQWYCLATQLIKPSDNWGFILHDYWDYIPNIQLSLCFYKLGNIEEAIQYNNKAGEYKPKDAAVEHNRCYFESCLTK